MRSKPPAPPYLAKADRLSKAAKEQLANHERDFAEAVKGIPESHRDTAMLHFYTSDAEADARHQTGYARTDCGGGARPHAAA